MQLKIVLAKKMALSKQLMAEKNLHEKCFVHLRLLDKRSILTYYRLICNSTLRTRQKRLKPRLKPESFACSLHLFERLDEPKMPLRYLLKIYGKYQEINYK